MIKSSITALSLPFVNGRSFTVRVFVPEREEGERLPVIYMTDGQNLFEDDEVEFGTWKTDRAIADERQSSGKAAIIVGVHNNVGPKERAEDLAPASIGRFFGPPQMIEAFEPRGEQFDSFVINTLMPCVEESFPVMKGRANTAFCGSSSGGLQALFTGLTHPDIFSAVGALSPALFMYDPGDVESWLKNTIKEEMPFLYLYSGGADQMEEHIRGGVEQIGGVLEGLYPEGKLKKVIMPEQKHNEHAWALIFKDFLSIFLSN